MCLLKLPNMPIVAPSDEVTFQLCAVITFDLEPTRTGMAVAAKRYRRAHEGCDARVSAPGLLKESTDIVRAVRCQRIMPDRPRTAKVDVVVLVAAPRAGKRKSQQYACAVVLCKCGPLAA